MPGVGPAPSDKAPGFARGSHTLTRVAATGDRKGTQFVSVFSDFVRSHLRPRAGKRARMEPLTHFRAIAGSTAISRGHFGKESSSPAIAARDPLLKPVNGGTMGGGGPEATARP